MHRPIMKNRFSLPNDNRSGQLDKFLVRRPRWGPCRPVFAPLVDLISLRIFDEKADINQDGFVDLLNVNLLLICFPISSSCCA